MRHHDVRLRKVTGLNKVCKGTLRDPRFDQNTVRDSGKRKILTGKRDLAGFIKIWARDTGFFACMSGIRELSIVNREIKQEKFIKYLGLYIDSHLSWKFHIKNISKKY